MRTVLTLIAALTCASAFGQAFSIFDPAMQAQPVESAAPTYLLSENFDGSGAPSGWSIVGSGGYDWDFTDAFVSSPQSLQLVNSTADARAVKSITARTAVYFKLSLQQRGGLGATRRVFRLSNGSVNCASIGLATNGVTFLHGSISQTITRTTTTSTWVHIWGRWEKGTGANGVLEITVSDTDKSSGLTDTISNGNATASADKIELGSQQIFESGSFAFDDVILSETEIP